MADGEEKGKGEGWWGRTPVTAEGREDDGMAAGVNGG